MKYSFVLIVSALLSLAACQGTIETYNSVLLPPPAKNGPTVVLIALNGALCDPHAYIPFLQTVQATASNISLWVALPKFYFNMPFFASAAISASIKDLKALNVSTETIFVGGHSLGGITSQEYASSKNPRVKGLILLGSYMQTKFEDPQVNFPVPVLSLSGELDGLSKISRLTISFNQMLRHPQQKGHLRYPVAIVPGASHSSYLNGSIPSGVQASDLKAEISNEEAWKSFAKIINAFIDVQINPESSSTSQKLLLDYIYGVSYPLIQPLLEAFKLEGSPLLYNASIVGFTKWAVDNAYSEMDLSPERIKANISVQDYDFFDFVLSKPSVSYQNDTLSHQLYAYKSYSWLQYFDDAAYQSADYIGIKYKNSGAIYRAANLSGTPNQITCKDINQKAIDQVLASLTNTTLARYQKYGVKYVLTNDTSYSTGLTWVASGLSYDDKGDYINVSSSTLYTDVDSEIFAGMFYCKVLSPARIAEWVYTDSLRKNYSPKNFNKTKKLIKGKKIY